MVQLNKIFRQAAKSKIIVNAHNVKEGKSFTSNEKEVEIRTRKRLFLY